MGRVGQEVKKKQSRSKDDVWTVVLSESPWTANRRSRNGDRGIFIFPCSADHEQDWQPYPDDPYSAICDEHTCIPFC